MSNPTHVITVDAAGTLIRPWPSVGAVYGKTARGFGLSVKDEEVDRRFYEVFGKVQKDRKITSGKEKDFWKQVVLAVFEPHAEKRNLDPLFEELWELFARGDHWRLADGARDNAFRTARTRVPPGSSLKQRFPVTLRPQGSRNRLPVRKNLHLLGNGDRETGPCDLQGSGKVVRQGTFPLSSRRG